MNWKFYLFLENLFQWMLPNGTIHCTKWWVLQTEPCSLLHNDSWKKIYTIKTKTQFFWEDDHAFVSYLCSTQMRKDKNVLFYIPLASRHTKVLGHFSSFLPILLASAYGAYGKVHAQHSSMLGKEKLAKDKYNILMHV